MKGIAWIRKLGETLVKKNSKDFNLKRSRITINGTYFN